MLIMVQGMVMRKGKELSPMLMRGHDSLLENTELWWEGRDMLMRSPGW